MRFVPRQGRDSISRFIAGRGAYRKFCTGTRRWCFKFTSYRVQATDTGQRAETLPGEEEEKHFLLIWKFETDFSSFIALSKNFNSILKFRFITSAHQEESLKFRLLIHFAGYSCSCSMLLRYSIHEEGYVAKQH